MSQVTISGLSKAYDSSTPVVTGFDLTLVEGEFVALLGPSGCGKTTILRCLAGLEQPSGGTIGIGARTVSDRVRGVDVPPERRNLGLVFQNYALWPHMTVAANVAYPLRVRRVPRAERGPRVERALALVGLAGYGDRSAMALSGGQQQRVALARALVARPEVLLLDEPLSNLDAGLRRQLRGELRRIHRELPTTTLYVTHDQIEALTLADRVVVMNGGRVAQIGTPREVFEQPANRFVASFLGWENILAATVTAVGEGTVEVDSAEWGGRLTVRTDRAARPGEPVAVAVRASGLTLTAGGAPADAPAGSPVGVDILDAVHLGDSREYQARTAGGTLLAIREPAHRPVTANGPALATVSPDALVLLPGDPVPGGTPEADPAPHAEAAAPVAAHSS